MTTDSFTTLPPLVGLEGHCGTLRERWRSRTQDQSSGPTIDKYFHPVDADVTNAPVSWPTTGAFIDRALTHLTSSTQASPLVLVGEVGSGKSTLCLKLAWDILERFPGRIDPKPMLVPISQLKASRTPGEMVSRWLGEGISGGPSQGDVLEQHVKAGNVVLFLDGLDEGHSRLGATGVADLLDWATRLAKTSRCRVVVTCRLEYYRHITSGENRLLKLMSDAIVSELQSFGVSDIEGLCTAWFGDSFKGIDDALSLLPSVPLLRHPLFLIRVLDSARGKDSERPSLAVFLDELLRYVVGEREERKDLPSSVRPLSRYELLEDLCVVALEQNKLDVVNGSVTLEAPLAKEVVYAKVGDRGVGTGDTCEVDASRESALLDLVARTLLVQQNESLRVVHPWLFECLAAKRITKLLNTSGSEERLLTILRTRPLRCLPLVRSLVAAYLREAPLAEGRGQELLRACSEDSERGNDRAGFAAANLLGLLAASDPTILRQKSFSGQRLAETDLSGADLSETDLSNCDLTHARLWGTNLEGAKLAGASLAGARLDIGDAGAVLDLAFFPGDRHLLTLHARGYRVWNLGNRSVETGADWVKPFGSGAIAVPIGDWAFVSRPGAQGLELISPDNLDIPCPEIIPTPQPTQITGLSWGGVGDKIWLRGATQRDPKAERDPKADDREEGRLWIWCRGGHSNVGRFKSVPSEGFPAHGPFACGSGWAASFAKGDLFLVTDQGWLHTENIDVKVVKPAMAGMKSHLGVQLEARKVAMHSVQFFESRARVTRTSTFAFPAEVYMIDLRQDGLLAAAGDDRRIYFRRASDIEIAGPELPGPIKALRFSPTGRHLACAVELLTGNLLEVHIFRFGEDRILQRLGTALTNQARVDGADFRGCTGIFEPLRDRLLRAGARV